jgi:hypothetical protein
MKETTYMHDVSPRCGLDEAVGERGYSFLEKTKRNEYLLMIG